MKPYTFNGQRAGEGVEDIIKNHPLVLFWPLVKVVILIAIPIAILIFWGASTAFAIAAFVCVLLAIAIFSKAYYVFSASMLLITTERIIYLNQKNFFKRKIIETNLDKIQDVTSDTDGVVRTTFDFGDVIIRTAGGTAGSEIVVKDVAAPYEVQQGITKRIAK